MIKTDVNVKPRTKWLVETRGIVLH